MLPYSQDRKTLTTPSYFPPQILGYLSYQEEPEGFSTLGVLEDLMAERANEVADFTDFDHCEVDQH
jgi:hypothetical protein